MLYCFINVVINTLKVNIFTANAD